MILSSECSRVDLQGREGARGCGSYLKLFGRVAWTIPSNGPLSGHRALDTVPVFGVSFFPSPRFLPFLPFFSFPSSFFFQSNAGRGVQWTECLGGNITTHPNPGEESSEAMTGVMESEVGSLP